MKRVAYVFSTTVILTVSLPFVTMSASLAQSIPHGDRLSPAKLQQFSRDLTPSSSQDFFNAGQTHLEQEIRLLSRPRSPLNEPLLTVRQNATQLEPQPERPTSLPHNQGTGNN